MYYEGSHLRDHANTLFTLHFYTVLLLSKARHTTLYRTANPGQALPAGTRYPGLQLQGIL